MTPTDIKEKQLKDLRHEIVMARYRQKQVRAANESSNRKQGNNYSPSDLSSASARALLLKSAVLNPGSLKLLQQRDNIHHSLQITQR